MAPRSSKPRVTVAPPVPDGPPATDRPTPNLLSRTQSGSQQSPGEGSRRPQEHDNSQEEFNFHNLRADEESDDVATQSRTLGTTKSANDIATLFKVSLIPDKNENKRVCIFCGDKHGYEMVPKGIKNYMYSMNTGNSNLRKHLLTQHEAAYKEKCNEKSWDYATPKVKQPTVGDNRKMALPPFSPEAFLEYLVRFISSDDQSIRVVECPEFRDLMMLLRDSLSDKDIPRRDKVREAIIKQFYKEFEILKEELASSVGRVSLTTDIWSNQKLRSFLAVTAHWIAVKNSKLSLRAALIGFHLMKKNHTGRNIAKTLLHLIKRAGIENKIGHITLDNAENNTVAMQELEDLFEEDNIRFDHKDNHIRCYAHIINICVAHIASSLTKVDSTKDKDKKGKAKRIQDEDDGETTGDYVGEGVVECISSFDYNVQGTLTEWFDNVKRDPVNRARAVVRTIRLSGQRREEFAATIESGNRNGLFKDDDGNRIKVKDLQLIKDVQHRWDSLYLMISRLKELRPPLHCFFSMDKSLNHLTLTDGDWDVLDGLSIVLEAPHRVQQVMSAHATPVLSGAIPSFELFMTQWETLGEQYPNLKPWTDIGLKWAGKYYNRMDDTRAYIIAMFINPCIRFTWIEREWGQEYKIIAKKAILEVMRECNKDKSVVIATRSQAPASPVKHVPKFVSLPSKYILKENPIYPRSTTGISTEEDEFLKYKNGALSPEETDLVSFWEIGKFEYPRLFNVAMDYLPVQASSVPCEHVFSSAGETDTKKRNRLAPPLMEALQILKFIYKKERLNFTAGYKMEVEEPVVKFDSNDLLADLFVEDVADTTDKLLSVCGEDDSGED